MTITRELHETFLGGKFMTLDKGYRDKDGTLHKFYVDTPIDHKLMPIYKIEGHKVNTSILKPSQLGQKSVLYQVTYRLGNTGESTFVGQFVYSTPDFRTLMFTHPTLPNKTIGIPIMNIYSCIRATDK